MTLNFIPSLAVFPRIVPKQRASMCCAAERDATVNPSIGLLLKTL